MSKTTKSNTLKKKAMIEALTKTLGVVTPACKQVGIARSTFYEWVKNDPEFKAEVQDVEDISLDFSESSLFRQIKNENTTATIFHLKTKGKKRGYIERQEITGVDGEPSAFKIEIIDRTEDTDK